MKHEARAGAARATRYSDSDSLPDLGEESGQGLIVVYRGPKDQEIKRPRDQETKRPRDQETKRPRDIAEQLGLVDSGLTAGLDGVSVNGAASSRFVLWSVSSIGKGRLGLYAR
ncbi:hypothetical protein MBM_05287 [Drepanopeziza brunnea f. sp. 'multigermtubi' MB_m1]|uniref:Uncharacterized protein n=1 Tax=Marssonina brunnea f. sp. multigermtubi (strain MB_m1) TaxID=1072389 RepID=K1X829_MARBU|nr:uncharacterized protein MBM_05287 [Drepanopeziza brunnea f. sp. 'multigermtubi' MB_m1]EKD16818.1 hypothetical protein MBM_05287 [Drepanopeziza brunnea f. sp. 'multigermtubi' MB_m1]